MNNSTGALKTSIIAQWVLIVAAIAIGLYEENSLPEALRVYIGEQDGKALSLAELAASGLGVLALIGLIVSSIGIYRLRKWSRTLYVASCAFGAFIFLFMGPTVTPPVEGTLEYLANATEGFTVGLLYFSGAREHFDRERRHND